jgi:hypothetical protein
VAQSRSKRNYTREYQNYQGTPKQIHNRSLRNQARREYEKAHGNLPSKVDVDHAKPLIKGGGNDLSNLRPRSLSELIAPSEEQPPQE